MWFLYEFALFHVASCGFYMVLCGVYVVSCGFYFCGFVCFHEVSMWFRVGSMWFDKVSCGFYDIVVLHGFCIYNLDIMFLETVGWKLEFNL